MVRSIPEEAGGPSFEGLHGPLALFSSSARLYALRSKPQACQRDKEASHQTLLDGSRRACQRMSAQPC